MVRPTPAPVQRSCTYIPASFVVGEPEMSDAANNIQAWALGAFIVSVDHRKPAEHPFPAPLDDCYEALR